MRSMAETVLRMKLTPERSTKENTRRKSIVSGSISIGNDSSPLDAINSGRMRASSLTDPTLRLQRHSTRQMPVTSRLEQIEEELKSIGNGGVKGMRNNLASKTANLDIK
mmetsp:Transcript_41274/g.54241  ORF Transcript_41274/g.54241 Transcript_41274/m.54241 type:complete len:109 (+) Transcript_41274:1460-1786(+)